MNEYKMTTKFNWLEVKRDIVNEFLRWGVTDYTFSAANPANVLGVRCVDDKNNEVFWCDLSLRDALAMASSLNGAIQKYMNLTGKDAPDVLAHKKVRFSKS